MVIDKNFYKWYEDTIFKISLASGIRENLGKELEAKREFGVTKYGKDSYQISEENTLNVDIKKHAKEELVDLTNYLLHMAIIRKMNKKSALSADLDDMIKCCQDMFNKIDDVSLEDFD